MGRRSGSACGPDPPQHAVQRCRQCRRATVASEFDKDLFVQPAFGGMRAPLIVKSARIFLRDTAQIVKQARKPGFAPRWARGTSS
jgi:hypothetical protein